MGITSIRDVSVIAHLPALFVAVCASFFARLCRALPGFAGRPQGCARTIYGDGLLSFVYCTGAPLRSPWFLVLRMIWTTLTLAVALVSRSPAKCGRPGFSFSRK